MIRSIRRAAMLAVATLAGVAGAQSASATSFVFLNGNSGPQSSINFSSSDGSGLSLSAYGLHLASTGTGKVGSTSATVETYSGYGMGVLYGSDNESNGTHQIDNTGGGVDYVALVFNQAVTLTDFALKAWGGSAVSTGTDAQFAAYAGTLASLQNGTVNTGIFATPSSQTAYYQNTSYTVDTTNSSALSKIWLVAANVNQTNDAFKLLYVDAAPNKNVGSVPEPASWAMMIVGFGAVGTSMRRRKSALPAAA